MEDNIGGMMEEIRNVVSSHLNEVKHELHETVDVLNKLPLVISLRAQIRELQEQNKQLQLLTKEKEEEKNIELEILEVEGGQTLEGDTFDKEEGDEDAGDDDGDADEDEGESSEEEENNNEDELGVPIEDPIAMEEQPCTATLAAHEAVEVEIWGERGEDASFEKLSATDMDVGKYGIYCESLVGSPEAAQYFIVKRGTDTYYAQDRMDGNIMEDKEGKVGYIVGKFENGIAFFPNII